MEAPAAGRGPVPQTLFSWAGGTIALPDPSLVLVSREDGGNLVVHPPRAVWERSELSSPELNGWSVLVAAAGRAMLDALPQLEGGCINYWEAGNWALNDAAEPAGPKDPRQHRSVHMHLLGRSPAASDPSWSWGEAPIFPRFADRLAWASRRERLRPEECGRIVARVRELMVDRYGIPPEEVSAPPACPRCGYPAPVPHAEESESRKLRVRRLS